MQTQRSLTIVIFGATGNLYADKLAKALYLLFLEGNLGEDFKILAFARRDFSQGDFRALTKDNILKKGELDASGLEDFVSHIDYFKGDFANQNDFVKLKGQLVSDQSALVLFHLATASVLYEKIFENIKNAGLNNLGRPVRTMIEKPFGKDEADAKHLQNILSGIFKEDEIFHIDHYLAKETARAVYDYKAKGEIEKIKIIFYESNTVGARGATYDKVGAFRDVGQNHMLQLLALAIMEKPANPSAKNIRSARMQALSDLFLNMEEKNIRAQYADYHWESGVEPNSQTETFFRIYLKSKNPKLTNVSFELEGGKGLADMHSDITTTTVAVEIYFENKDKENKKEIKIQPVPGTVYESYTKVYNDVLKGDPTFFVSIEEILAEWRLTDELMSKWKNIPLLVYKKGSKAEEIQ